MCGIVATWGTKPALANLMVARLAHRGPDGTGYTDLLEPNISLAHRRLSIIDPDGGQQPLQTHSSGASLVANGMIYNDLALRETLSSTKFATGSDSESILNSIRRFGTAGVEKLDGMFAFVFATDEKLIAARDPIGIKPLYIGLREGGYCFASEIKALDPYVDEIREFPPGHIFDSNNGFRRYYTLPQASDDITDVGDAINIIQKTLTAAIEKRLRSDVPIGLFLSGGLDSSIIAAVASQYRPGIKSFSVGVAGSPDLLAAREVADHLGTDHYEYTVTKNEVERDLPDILRHLESFDADLVQSAIPCYYVSRLAAQHVKVVLTGEGADELFAGYDYHKEYKHQGALQAELRRSVLTMHNINLQRVDRMSMAHGLEARVPFLDRTMLDMAFRIPVNLKLPAESRVEKWILRKAFEHLLPQQIVWRDKSQFDQGSGVKDILNRELSDNSESTFPTQVPQTMNQAAYRKMLIEQFENKSALQDLVAHWDSTARIDDLPTDDSPIVTELSARTNRNRSLSNQPNEDFSALYNLATPQPYFHKMKQLDYRIPASSNRIYAACIDEIFRTRKEQEVAVLDLCAGYGINGALLKSDYSLEQLYAYFGVLGPETAGDPFFDRLTLVGTAKRSQNVRVTGVDVAENALSYGRLAGFMDETHCVDLEEKPIPAALETTIGDCSLITVTGGFSFIGANTFDKILTAIDKAQPDGCKPWIAGFPLLHTQLAELLSLLNAHGYTIEPLLECRLRQRQYANSSEKRREMEALERADLKPLDDNYFESHLLLARPLGEPPFQRDILEAS